MRRGREGLLRLHDVGRLDLSLSGGLIDIAVGKSPVEPIDILPVPDSINDILRVDLNVVAKRGIALVIDVRAEAVEPGVRSWGRSTGRGIWKRAGEELLLQL